MSPWWLLVPGLVIELVFALLLRDWKGVLRREAQRIERTQSGCYACITEASLTSFSRSSAMSFCQEHTAHYMLIHDLEEKACE